MGISIPKVKKPLSDEAVKAPVTMGDATDPLEAAAVPVPPILPDNSAPRESHEVAVKRAEKANAARLKAQAEKTVEMEAVEATRDAERVPRLKMEARVVAAEEAVRVARLALDAAQRELAVAKSEAGHAGPRRWKVTNAQKLLCFMPGGGSAWMSPGDDLREDHYGGLAGIDAIRSANPKLSLELIGG